VPCKNATSTGDPPAWTAARAGKPEGRVSKAARRAEDASPPLRCEMIGLFHSESEAQSAADALLTSGFNLVDIGPPQRHGDLGAGIGARAGQARPIGIYAAFGALAAGAVASLFLPRGARNVIVAAAGGAIGAASAYAMAPMMQRHTAGPAWPPGAVLLRVGLKSPADQTRALAILEAQGACKLHVSLLRTS
jgi:hypothetical protein